MNESFAKGGRSRRGYNSKSSVPFKMNFNSLFLLVVFALLSLASAHRCHRHGGGGGGGYSGGRGYGSGSGEAAIVIGSSKPKK
ncbi:unnamed protein product [Caenorhabditis nigoni]